MPKVAFKKTWPRVGFGDVVKLSGERSSNPEEDGFERFVGLEHIEPGDLKIRRWGDVADGTTFTSVFRPGQVLFGKRRAYQRKVAVADFNGVCSGDIYVLEPRNAHLLPELLPFICQTNGFFEHAVGTSAGSLSPRTNWDSLASYEFNLPPLEEQQRLVDILEATRDLEERAFTLVESLRVARESWLELEFSTLARKWPEKVASELMERITVGIVVRPADLYVPRGQGIPALRSLNILPAKVVMEDLVYISREGHAEHEKSRLTPGDVVIVRSGRPGDAAVVPSDAGELNCIDLIVCGSSPELVPQFLCAALNSRFGRRQFAAGAAGTAQKHFNVGAFKDFKVPVPPKTLQSRFVDKLHDFTQLVTEAERRLNDVRRVRLDLMWRVFQT